MWPVAFVATKVVCLDAGKNGLNPRQLDQSPVALAAIISDSVWGAVAHWRCLARAAIAKTHEMNDTTTDPDQLPQIRDELDLLEDLVPLTELRLIELGCGTARLARALVNRHPGTRLVGLEVDLEQHSKNVSSQQERLLFVAGSAEAVPFPDAGFDGALMLKSLHHVPLDGMDTALAEVARVVKPGGWLYVSEPIFGGALNEIVRLYNDENTVRRAAQTALDRALASGTHWEAVTERRFAQPAHFDDWADFERRMLYPSFADHHITPALTARVHTAFVPHMTSDGAHFVRPMHARLLRRKG
jgi:ubiquinone/menaquinone biosynthesis C-methylase UbiE